MQSTTLQIYSDSQTLVALHYLYLQHSHHRLPHRPAGIVGEVVGGLQEGVQDILRQMLL